MKVKPLTKNRKAGKISGHENKFGFEHIEAVETQMFKTSLKNMVLEATGQGYIQRFGHH